MQDPATTTPAEGLLELTIATLASNLTAATRTWRQRMEEFHDVTEPDQNTSESVIAQFRDRYNEARTAEAAIRSAITDLPAEVRRDIFRRAEDALRAG